MNTNEFKGWKLFIIVTLLLFVMVAMPKMIQAAGPTYGGELIYAYGAKPMSLDPHLGRAGGDAYFWRRMYDHIVGADANYVSRPELSLATSWEIPDPKTMVFHLRKGVKFHDGTDFNGEAIKFNIERMLAPDSTATPKASFSVVEKVEVVNPHLVKFHLKRPWGAGLGMIADRGGAVNSPTAIKKHGKQYGFNPVGTGPFKFVEYVSGSHAKFAKNENYWGKDTDGNRLPFLDAVTLKIIMDQSVLTAALRSGEIDLAFLPPQHVDKFQADARFNVKRFEGGSIGHLIAFNTAMPPMDNVNLRRAVAHAINPEFINKAVFYGKNIIAKAGMWPVGCWVFDDTVPRPYYNLEKAREFLKKGGKPKGFSMDLITYNSTNVVQTAEMVQAQLAQIGIKVSLKTYDVGTMVEKFWNTKETPMMSTGWSRYPEPDWIASLCYKSTGYYNASKAPRPDMDKLIQQGASTYDIAERKAIYRKINEIVLDEAWYVPMLYGVSYAGAWRKVQGTDTLFGWDAKFLMKELWLKK